MDLTPLVPAGRRIIEAYGDGGFRISGVRHSGSVLVFPELVIAWAVARWSEIDPAQLLSMLIEASRPQPELILLGTGSSLIRPDAGLRLELRAKGIGMEAMDTGAACRTYNVLLAEGRLVAAALIAVE
jgi:uncharacterized protein